ncbi:uncharacterized protein ACN427_012330 isoform 2-T2 [Glossina fuscipes fuscipes]
MLEIYVDDGDCYSLCKAGDDWWADLLVGSRIDYCFRDLTTAAATQQQLQQQRQSQHSKTRNSCFNFTKFLKHLKMDGHPYTMLTLLLVIMAIGLCTDTVLGNPTQQQHQHQQQQYQQTNTVRVQQCREGCLEKFTTRDALCQQNSACLRCWEECIKSPPAKMSKSIRETWSLHTVSMLQQDSLVLVDVAWEPLSLPNQCLVTWEVSGGGLMGNLLTESFNVQLSLWPDTNYRVQVTCKNKLTGLMSRSLPLTIDTSDAVKSLDTNLLQIRPTLRKQVINPYITNKPIIRSTASQAPIEPVTKKQMSNSFDSNVVPYEDQSAEHTNFIFNWHMRKNSDISSIEPLNKPDLNMLTIAALSDMQKPLVFGMVAGTILLTFILLLYVCMMRQQRLTSDKTSLMGDEVHAQVMSMPPVLPATTVAAATGTTVLRNSEDICKNPASCSRYALKV